MNRGVKRYRQTSIIESFAFSKKTKSTSMEEGQFILDSPMNKSPPESPSKIQKSEIKDQASNKNSTSSLLDEAFQDTSNVPMLTSNVPICNEGNGVASAKLSRSIIDELWDTDDEQSPEVKNENSQSIIEKPKLKLMEEKPCKEEETCYRSSADLFPDEPSLEDEPGPSSSGGGGSQDIFDSQEELFDSQPPDEDETSESSSSSSDSEFDDIVLNRSPDCDMPLPNLEPSENHSIMFSPHIRPGDAPLPFPRSYRDKWDPDHVRMPCSPYNRYPIQDSAGNSAIGSRWEYICRSLMTDIESSQDLEEAIMKYNDQYKGRWNFMGLHYLINQHWMEEEREFFFESMLPAMIEMAMSLPSICTQPVPLLKRRMDHYVTLSQKQIACLLLNAFFCTFPRRNARCRQRWNSEYVTYPDINFNRLFYGTKAGCPRNNAEKLKCLFNYFRRITSREPTGTVTFHRQVIAGRKLPLWHSSTRGIRIAVIKSHGLIEDDGHGMLQVDFANKFIGGGVLGQGCVQEEIRFVVCPELIISRLFVEGLEDNEALIITGAEQYNIYSGYGSSFKWEGDFKDNTPRDSWGRRCTKIVAIDATHFIKESDQFVYQSFRRELNKAYCGFYENFPPNHLSAVATGNWGCGAFKGSPDLKFLIQLMAASECNRNMVYYTFQNKKLKKSLQEMYEFINDKNLAVGDLWRLLTDYMNNISNSRKSIDLYPFIYSQFQTKVSHQHENKNYNEPSESCKRIPTNVSHQQENKNHNKPLESCTKVQTKPSHQQENKNYTESPKSCTKVQTKPSHQQENKNYTESPKSCTRVQTKPSHQQENKNCNELPESCTRVQTKPSHQRENENYNESPKSCTRVQIKPSHQQENKNCNELSESCTIQTKSSHLQENITWSELSESCKRASELVKDFTYDDTSEDSEDIT